MPSLDSLLSGKCSLSSFLHTARLRWLEAQARKAADAWLRLSAAHRKAFSAELSGVGSTLLTIKVLRAMAKAWFYLQRVVRLLAQERKPVNVHK